MLNRDLHCDDHYNDSICDFINPWFQLEDNLKSNLPYVFAEKIHLGTDILSCEAKKN